MPTRALFPTLVYAAALEPRSVRAFNARLLRETAHLKAQLARAELIIEVQKKVLQLLGLPEIPLDEIT